MMDEDFLDEEITSQVQRYEKMVRNKTTDYFDAETLESIIDFYLTKEKPKKALEVVYYAEDIYPQQTGFLLQKAEVFGALGKFGDAIDILEKLELYEPFNPELHLLKGEMLLNLESFDEAEECFNRAMNNSDDRLNMLFEIAYIYQDCDLQTKALDMFETIIREFPEVDQAKYEIANCHDMLGRFELALEIYQKLVDDDPYSSNAWYNLGVTYSKMGMRNEAIHAFDYTLLIEEDHVPARFNKANELVELGKYEEALEEYFKVQHQEGSDSITCCNIAGCYERMNRNDLAREYYRKATKLNPNIAEAWFGIGLTYDKESQQKEALNNYKRAVLLEPDNTEYLIALAELEYRMGNIQEAEDLYRKLIELDPVEMDAWLDWSYVLYSDGQKDTAIELLREAVRIEPDCYQYHYRLAAYLFATGNNESAKEHLETALLLNFAAHSQLFEILPELAGNESILQLIELYRNNHEEL